MYYFDFEFGGKQRPLQLFRAHPREIGDKISKKVSGTWVVRGFCDFVKFSEIPQGNLILRFFPQKTVKIVSREIFLSNPRNTLLELIFAIINYYMELIFANWPNLRKIKPKSKKNHSRNFGEMSKICSKRYKNAKKRVPEIEFAKINSRGRGYYDTLVGRFFFFIFSLNFYQKPIRYVMEISFSNFW